MSRRLRDAKVAIWGFGGIARTLAPLYTALGANIIGIARTPRADGPFTVVDDVDAVLPTVDVLVNILPTAPSTDRALDARRLALLPRTAWLVNVGRGSTVDEDALVDALRGGALAGAALDVYEAEPHVSEELLALENVVLTPHIGSATRETREAMGMLCVEALRAVLLEDRRPENAVV